MPLLDHNSSSINAKEWYWRQAVPLITPNIVYFTSLRAMVLTGFATKDHYKAFKNICQWSVEAGHLQLRLIRCLKVLIDLHAISHGCARLSTLIISDDSTNNVDDTIRHLRSC